MTYIEKARALLIEELGHLMEDGPLVDLYLLLVFVKGEAVTLENVHDAWAIRESRAFPTSRLIAPFQGLTPEVQELDREFMEAIQRVARELKVG